MVRGSRRGFVWMAGVMALLATRPVAASCATPVFEVRTNPFMVRQAPAWTPDGEGLIYFKPSGDAQQLFTARLDGSNEVCLTCGQPGANQFAQYSPDGRWVLFHSNRGKTVKLLAPGGGGLGSDIYAMRPDGSQVSRLTLGSEGQDNFHAYLSPDGKRLAWTHIDWALDKGGTGYWDVRIADFVEFEGGARLEDERVLLPPNGDFYETQHWSPDGRGLLVTRSRDNAMNLELHFLDLSVDPPALTRLTDDAAWDEQAIFTPDGRKVIFMSTRDHPGTWETWAYASRLAGIPGGRDHTLTPALFLAMFNSPVFSPATDLYELDVETRSVRRLTYDGDDGWITPEFNWDPAGERLVWTQLRWGDRMRVDSPPDASRQLNALLAPGTDTSDFQRVAQGLSQGRFAEAQEKRTRIARYVCGMGGS